MAYQVDFTKFPELVSQFTESDVDTSHLAYLDRALHELWGLGRNLVLVWVAHERAIDALVIPHYTLSEFAARHRSDDDDPLDMIYGVDERSDRSKNVLENVISGPTQVDEDEFAHLCTLLDGERNRIDLPFEPGVDVPYAMIESLVKRYSISYVEDRAVALFDIVGFSLLSALDQVTQLNSLAFSVNSAYSKMLSNDIEISFARSTTGDGFYIWNRDRSIQANVNLYHFMHLVLADNAIARSKSAPNTTPHLRGCFHVGGHYEFYQSEGLNPTVYSYIVGDVTIELARMIDRALPGQILVGDFWVNMPDWEHGMVMKIDTLQFIEKAQESLSNLQGLVLSGDNIDSIKCYLTGEKTDDDSFGISRFQLADKHGRLRNVYNAKVNIYRRDSDPIFLGLQVSDLDNFDIVQKEFVKPVNHDLQ
jgi:hypothetical protein